MASFDLTPRGRFLDRSAVRHFGRDVRLPER
jgi:hypothetical protein